VPDPAKVSLAFFANIGNAPDGPAKAQAGFPGRPQDPQQGHKPGTVVGNPRQVENASNSVKFQLHVTREYGIEVGADNNGIRPTLTVRHDHITESIDRRGEPRCVQRVREMTRPFALFKRRRRNQSQPNLVGFDIRLSLFEDSKGVLNAGIREDCCRPASGHPASAGPR
jgi:hypothetical protein